MEKFDVAVIGSGPGGYTAAIAASQKGMKSVCIEKAKTFGGTCLNIGCIPSKALLESTAAYDFIKHHGFSMGIEQEGLKFNFDQMMKRKSGIVKIITDGVKSLFQKNKVHSILGEASLRGPHEIHVNGDVIQAEQMLFSSIQHRHFIVETEELFQRQQPALKPNLLRARNKMAEVNRKLFVV